MKSKKVVKLTESDLERIIKRVLNEQPTGEVKALNECIDKKQIRDNVDVSFSTSCKTAFQKLDNDIIDKKALYACATDMKFKDRSRYRYFGGELDKCLKVINEQESPIQPTGDVEAINDCINERVPDKSDLRGLFSSCNRALTSLENGEIEKEALYTCTRDMMMNGTPDVQDMGYDLVKCFMDVLGKKY